MCVCVCVCCREIHVHGPYNTDVIAWMKFGFRSGLGTFTLTPDADLSFTAVTFLTLPLVRSHTFCMLEHFSHCFAGSPSHVLLLCPQARLTHSVERTVKAHSTKKAKSVSLCVCVCVCVCVFVCAGPVQQVPLVHPRLAYVDD